VADINLERKDTTIWPWVVGLLALVLVIWGVWAATDGRNGDLAFDDDPIAAPGAEEQWEDDRTARAAPQSVQDFLEECATGAPMGQPGQAGQEGQAEQDRTRTDEWGQDQRYDDPGEYAEHCIDQMITAMEDVVDQSERDTDHLDEELDRLRQRADALGEEDSESPQYTMHVQEILTSAAMLMERIQEVRPGIRAEAQTQVQELQRIASEMQAQVPIAQQGGELNRFFQRIGTTLQMMGEEQ
jgi:hypothetical protein